MALDYSIIGKRLKQVRKDKKITQEALSEKLDVSVAFLSRLERGITPISLRRLNEICEILGITEGSILSGASEQSKNYLSKEFKELLDICTPEQQKLIYEISKIISEQ